MPHRYPGEVSDVLTAESMLVTSAEQLAALYPPPLQRSLDKESPVVTPGYAELIAASPFVVVATHGPDGIDCSPRGDAPGFIQVLDEHTLLLPDRRGNNRHDTLHNLLHDPAIALIFLVPGISETFRVRGSAVISTDPQLRNRFEVQGTLPTTVLVITVQRVYFQCRRAVLRGKLWDADRQVDPATLPSSGRLLTEAGAMTAEQSATYDRELPETALRTLYRDPPS